MLEYATRPLKYSCMFRSIIWKPIKTEHLELNKNILVFLYNSLGNLLVYLEYSKSFSQATFYVSRLKKLKFDM